MSAAARSLAAAVFLVGALLTVESLGLRAAWLPLDEAAVVERARGGTAFTEPLAGPLLPWLLRPVRGAAPDDLYGLAQALSVLCWAVLVVPAYLLARRGASQPASLAAAVLAAIVPASAFALAVVPDAAATLLAAFAVLACVRAAERRSLRLLVLALALAALAALARPWLALLPLALALAYALVRVPVGRLLRWPGSLAFAALAGAAYAAWWPLTSASPALERALNDPSAVARGAVASLAPLALGLGVVPWLAAWSAARRPRADPTAAAFVILAPVLALSAGIAAAARGGPSLDERPLLVLVPLVCALAAQAWSERRVSATAVASGAVTLAAATVLVPGPGLFGPVQATVAPGLALFAGAGGRATFIEWSLLAAVAAAGVLLADPRRLPAAALVGAAVLVVSGQLFAYHDARDAASRVATALPGAHDWLDRLVPAGETVTVVSAGEPAVRDLLAQTAIWNRTLGPELAVDPTAADLRTGALPDGASPSFVLATGVALAGEPLASTAAGELVRAAHPLGLAATTEGVSGDGWSGAEAVYRRFSGGPGVLRVTVSRTAWGGQDVPGTVTVAVPGAAPERLVIHAGQQRTLDLRAPAAPFKVRVTVSPTFSPADFGQGDTRQLGAQLGFDFRPK